MCGCSTCPPRPTCSSTSATGSAQHELNQGAVARGAGKADRPRPGQRQPDQRRGRRASSTNRRPSASTTTSARRRCRTCWRCASAMRCSSRCGTPRTSTTCRSPWPKPSASAIAPATTTTPARMRDMVQNHMLQLLCMVAMEPPSSLEPDAVRDEKLKVLNSLKPIDDQQRQPADRARPVPRRRGRGRQRAGLPGRAGRHQVATPKPSWR